MAECLFCKIINGEIPSEKVYEDEKVLAFKDINPQAKVHLLIIPKEHIASLAEINEDNAEIVSALALTANKLAKEYHLNSGFRVVTNVGSDGGQTVEHLHFHLLGGEKLTEKMC